MKNLTKQYEIAKRNANKFMKAGLIPQYFEALLEMNKYKRLMTAVNINSGKTVVREGDVGREFMIILSGTASVSRQGNKFATLGPGDFFGEMSLLGKGPRSATVIAETDLLLEALNRREFATMLHKNPEIAEKILADAHDRSTQEASMSEAI